MQKTEKNTKDVKCVVWDLDNTLWDGVVLESDDVRLKPGIKDIIQTLDSRGILQSIASKGNYDDAMDKLRQFGLADYFLYPEISWNAKSVSIGRIRDYLNIGMDTFVFVDDQPFERDEVSYAFSEVLCIDSAEYETLPDHPRLNPRFITEDSRRRRLMYLEEMERNKEEEDYEGPKKDFLGGLRMEFLIGKAREEDLQRAEELTDRTNQLNTTGITYSYDRLREFMHSDRHTLLTAELRDKYGSYGKIGLALIESDESAWNLKLFLMSCRVMARGAGTVFLTHIMNEAKSAGKVLRADFKKTDRNRMMFITFKFANFKVIDGDGTDNLVLENDLSLIQEIPEYIDVIEV
jgi:FkbH-like protein